MNLSINKTRFNLQGLLMALFAAMIMAMPSTMEAQVGNTGVILDAEITPKCYQDDTSQVSFFSVYIFRIGDPNPTLLGHFDTDGAPYIIPDPTLVNIGQCLVDTTYDYEMVPKCDTANNTSYYSLILHKTSAAGAITTSKVGDYDVDGGTYSPGANPIAGYCTLPGSDGGGLDTLYDYEFIPRCDTANNTSFYTLIENKTVTLTGITFSSDKGDYDMDGSPYVSGANPIAGYCTLPGADGLDTLYDYELVLKCDTDNDVGYFTLMQKKTVVATGDVILTKVGDFNANGGNYTPGASIIGTCPIGVPRAIPLITRFTLVGSANIIVPANTMASISITNIGFVTGTITVPRVGGAPFDLLPGENYSCSAQYDYTNNEWNVCPEIAYNATGTNFRVVYSVIAN
jgi:hypothetical protein